LSSGVPDDLPQQISGKPFFHRVCQWARDLWTRRRPFEPTPGGAMRAVDTNLLVRLITNDDEAQARVAEEFIAAGAWIPHIVLAETVWVLASAFDLSRGKIAEAVAMLLNHTSLAIQDSEVVSAALENFRQYAGVEFSDCLALESARRAGHLPFGTFDRRFSQLPGVQRL
jgi:predicted nucleic-acid-binding protein